MFKVIRTYNYRDIHAYVFPTREDALCWITYNILDTISIGRVRKNKSLVELCDAAKNKDYKKVLEMWCHNESVNPELGADTYEIVEDIQKQELKSHRDVFDMLCKIKWYKGITEDINITEEDINKI